MKIYEDQPLEAKQISVKDKKRLRRLKKKAEGESAGPEKVEEAKTLSPTN
jgi:hypothetical protein